MIYPSSAIYLSPYKKAYLIISSIFLLYSTLSSQNQILSDSLELIYTNSVYQEKDKLKILMQLAIEHTDIEKKLSFSLELIHTATTLDSNAYLVIGYSEKGNALRLKSELDAAIESYFQAAKIALDNNIKTGGVYVSIADVYSIMGNPKNAKVYYNRALKALRIEQDSINLASALLNAGDEYFNQGQLDTALIFTKEADSIFEKVNYPLGQAYALGNMGMIEAAFENDGAAEKNMNQAIILLEELGSFYPIAVYLTYISDIYQKKGNPAKALDFATQSLELAQKHQLKQQISDAHLKLSELYEKANQPNKSLAAYKAHITYRDSVNNLEEVQKIADLRTDFEVSQKQIEVDLLNQEKKIQQVLTNGLAAILGLITFFSFLLYKNYKSVVKARKESDELLLNILPAETAAELKENGKVVAKKMNAVTVLFTDFKDFTKHTEKIPAELLVARIDYYFSAFDAIIEKHGLEKIKTIGDAYMCVGGLPLPTADHATKTVAAALDIIDFISQEKQNAPKDTLIFDIRIGINTGPVVAGVVGIKKFAYDIWGDTVNIASRMETNSQLGKINISSSTYDLVKDIFDCAYRGEITVKNKGLMKMYFVTGK